jgi:hypothetical protein
MFRWLKLPDLFERCQLGAAPAAAPDAFNWGVIGRIALGVSVGVQVMVSALLLVGRSGSAFSKAELTARGVGLMRPERETLLYVVSCALVLVLTLAFAFAWTRRKPEDCPHERRRPIMQRAALQLGLAIGSMVLFLLIFPVAIKFKLLEPRPVSWQHLLPGLVLQPRPVSWQRLLPGLVLLMPSLVALLVDFVALLGLRTVGNEARLAPLIVGNEARLAPLISTSWQRVVRVADTLVDIVALIVVLAVVYIPDYRRLAGIGFLGMGRPTLPDHSLFEVFHHWNYFAMGPALAFSHGAALVTDAFAQYGLGWPMVYAALSPLVPLQYGPMMHVAVLYGCIYLAALYVFLRLWSRSTTWSVLALFLSVALYLFSGNLPRTVLWIYPSFTVLRSPTDVWFFLAMLMHLRTKQPVWALLGGAMVGLGVLFETETGLMLATVFALYWVFSLGLAPAERWTARVRERIGLPLMSGLVAAIIVFVGFWVGSRGTVLSHVFWSNWLEAIPIYQAGIGLNLLAKNPHTATHFIAMVTLYMFVLAGAMLNVLRRRAGGSDLIRGTVAVYGLCLLVLFVSRTYPYALYPLSIPFAMLLVDLVARTWQYARMQLERVVSPEVEILCRVGHVVAPYLTILVVMLVLAEGNPAFDSYPGLFNVVAFGAADAGDVCLMESIPDVCGLPSEFKSLANDFRQVRKRLTKLSASGQVAILDDIDTIYYAAAGIAPWARYSPLFPNLILKTQLDQVVAQLEARPPDYVLMRPRPDYQNVWGSTYEDVWSAMRRVVVRSFIPDDPVGPFEVWRRPGPGDFRPPSSSFQEGVELKGVRLSADELQPGESLGIGFWWEARKPTAVSYSVFMHLLDSNGQRVAQTDELPDEGRHLTTSWQPGQAVYDRHSIVVPASALPGPYTLQIGLYDSGSGQRLSILDQLGNPLDSKLEVASIRVRGLSPGEEQP